MKPEVNNSGNNLKVSVVKTERYSLATDSTGYQELVSNFAPTFDVKISCTVLESSALSALDAVRSLLAKVN